MAELSARHEVHQLRQVQRLEAMSYLEHDPFAVEGVFADCELLEWLIEGVNPDLLASDFTSERSASAVSERGLLKP
jgi:hypothetical protein